MRFRTALGGWPAGYIPNGPFRLNTNSPQKKGLVGWWPTFDSANSNVLREYMWGADGAFQGNTTWRFLSEMGFAIDCPGGAGDYVLSTDNSIFDFAGNAFSIAVWVEPDTIEVSWMSVVEKRGAAAGWILDLGNGNGRANLWIHNGGWANVLLDVADALSAGNLYHLVATWDGTTGRLYVNGIERQSGGIASPLTSPAGNALNLGYNSSSTVYYDGALSYPGLWNYALPPRVVWSLYSQGTRFELAQPVRRMWAVKSPVVVARRIFITHW